MNQQRWITPKAAKDFLLTKCISPLVDKMYESKDFDLDGYMEFFNRKARKSLKKLRPFFVFEKESINQSNGTASNIKEEIILDDFEDGEDHDTNNGNNDESTKESDSVNELPQNFDQECASKKKKKKKQKNQVSFLETDQSNEDCQKVGQKRKCPDDGQKSKKLTKSSENIETEPFIRHESFSLSEATTSDSPPNQFSSDSTNRKSPVHEDTDTILSAGGAGRSSVETESVQLNRPPIKLESITTEMQTEDSVGTNSSVPTSSIPRDITAVGRIIRVERPVTDAIKMFQSTVTRRSQPSVMPEDRASVISEEQEAEDTLEELENVLIFADKENQKTVQSTDSNLPEEAPTDSTVPEDDPSENMVSSMWRELDTSGLEDFFVTPVDIVLCNICHKVCHRNEIFQHWRDHSISCRFLSSKMVHTKPPQLDSDSAVNNQNHCSLEISCAINSAASSSTAIVCERYLSRTSVTKELESLSIETPCLEFRHSPEKTAAKLLKSSELKKSFKARTIIYDCDNCENKFRSKKKLKEHILKQSCKKKLNDIMELKTPATTCKVTKLNNCGFKTNLKRPFKKSHFKRCNTGVDSRSVAVHQEVHKPFKCSLCFCAYVSKNSLNRHLKKHDFERFKATEDSRTGASNQGVQKSFKCETCEYFYSSRRNLRRHIKRMHSVEKINTDSQPSSSLGHLESRCKRLISKKSCLRRFPCGICNETFRSSSQATNHQRVKHSKALLKSITKLPKSLVLTKNDVLEKKRIDATTAAAQCIPKIYYCSLCHIRFSNQSLYRRHEKLHRNQF